MPPNGRTNRPVGRLVDRTGCTGSVARFWQKTYAPDYVAFALLLTAYILVQLLMEPFHRLFSLRNLNIQYPHALVERVPVIWNIIYAGVVPLVILILWLAVSRVGMHQFHVTLLGFFIALLLTSFITDVTKNAVGRPRPDLISRCLPATGTSKDILVSIDVCMETDPHILAEGWKSFPSGHSSFAFSGLGFLSLFFCGQLHVFRPRTDLGRVLIAFIPILGAALIAISRCEDYRHDVYDVTCGSILGMGIAYFSYRRYYPRLHSQKCHEPFPSRAMSFNSGVGQPKDDEEAEAGAGLFELDDSDEAA